MLGLILYLVNIILPDILILKRLASVSDSGIRAYTNLRKSNHFSSRKSLSKSTESVCRADGNINSSHLTSHESIIFSNEKNNVHFASDESILSSNEESNVHFASDESILSSNEESNVHFASDESILSLNEESNVHFASDKSILSSNEESNVHFCK